MPLEFLIGGQLYQCGSWIPKGRYHMYHRNYLFLQYPDGCYTAGKPYTVEVPRPGKYKVVATLKADSVLEKVSVYAGAGSLAFTGSIPAGLSKQAAVVHVGNHIPKGQECVCQDRTVSVTVMAEKNCLSGLYISEISCPTIYIAGSVDLSPFQDIAGTDKPKASSSSRPKGNSSSRWAQMLAAHTNHKIAVSDCSCPGLTTESFLKKGLSAAINEYSKPGDFCFLCFDPTGHPLEAWKPGGSCRRQLARYIITCRDRFLYPVLLTPASLHPNGNTDNYAGQLWKQCLDAYREVGTLTATPVIELHKLHVTPYDANVTAGFAAQEIARVCSTFPGREYRFLAKCMR